MSEPYAVPVPRGYRVGVWEVRRPLATGAFGTVPGLMLLHYLTDSLGIAALAAGAIVFLPKAWDVVLNPVAGRISDRTSDARIDLVEDESLRNLGLGHDDL